MIKQFVSKNFELLFWITALIALAVADPNRPSHYTLCPLKLMGVSWCPGCGLGHSIASIFHGDIKTSFSQHWFGVPALSIILFRVVVLARVLTHPVSVPIAIGAGYPLFATRKEGNVKK